MANVIISSAQDLLALKGCELGYTPWLKVTQDRIDKFADATNDHQWIHIDLEEAAKGPFGRTIAHGYLTLSLATFFVEELIEFKNLQMGVNYGCNKVRFPAPVLVDTNIRGKGEIVEVIEEGNSLQLTTRLTVEAENQEKPACVIEILSRLTFN